jgi:hypothetical protein
VLGGSNASTLGGAAALAASSKDISGSYTAQIGWGLIKKSGSFQSHERSSSSMAVAAMAGYDTLSNWSIDSKAVDPGSYQQLLSSAAENMGRGWGLPGRVVAKTGEIGLGLEPRSRVLWDKCETLCHDGLVVELLLLPYAQLRQYVSACLVPK